MLWESLLVVSNIQSDVRMYKSKVLVGLGVADFWPEKVCRLLCKLHVGVAIACFFAESLAK